MSLAKKKGKKSPPSEMGKKDIKNYFNLASIFPQKLSAKYFSSIKNKENPITYFFFLLALLSLMASQQL